MTGRRIGFQGWHRTTCAGVLSSWARYQLAAVTVPCLSLARCQLFASADSADQIF